MHVDRNSIRRRLEALAAEAHRGCGLSHDVYVQRFSDAVNREYARADSVVRAAAIEAARSFDYATPAEIEAMHEAQEAGGYCVHGLDSMTCPAGCFE